MTTLALFLLLWCGLSLIAAAVWSLWVTWQKRYPVDRFLLPEHRRRL